MRHFGHGVGHLQFERQHEIEPDRDDIAMALEVVSDSTDNLDTTGDSDPEELDIVHDSDEEELYDEEGDLEGDASGSDIRVISDSESDGSDFEGYASY
jgi:hypothetical protein